jgi:hypothetical protein
MRDIQDDLRQRITKITIQRAELKNRLAWLDKVEEHLKVALEYERAQSDAKFDTISGEDVLFQDQSTLTSFVREALADYRPCSLSVLKDLAKNRKLDFGEKNPGRVLHFVLIGLKHSGLTERDKNGLWRLLRPEEINANYPEAADETGDEA